MWRNIVPGFVARVLNRCHANAANAPLRLTQSHHVEDEVLESTSSQKEDEQKNNKQRSFHFCNAEIPPYTALDAVGWGAAAVIFINMCRRIHSSLSSGGDVTLSPLGVSSSSSSSSSLLQRCGQRLLLDSFCRNDILPERTALCLQEAAESQNSDQSETPDTSSSDQQGADLSPEEELSASDWSNRDSRQTSDWSNRDSRQTTQDNDEGSSADSRLSEAAVNLSQVGDASVPVVLNIIGLQSAEQGDEEAAFVCFHQGALQGYRKAQFNTAVCYETGRGTPHNIHKALHWYGQAAAGNHSQAQYRYAKLLLSSRGRQRTTEDLHTAISLLEKSSAAGLTEAQVFLASLLSEEPIRDARRSVVFLQMAAERGSSRARLILAQCYDRGVGVEQNHRRALELYQQAARDGDQRAAALLTSAGREAALRSIRSAPCFQRAVQPGSFLPHSRSAGNLTGNLHLYAPPPCSDITLGVG